MSLVLISLLLPVVLAIAAFAINVVYMELARTELQIATDVATRAAGRTLAVTGSEQQAIAAADRLLKANPFCNQTIPLDGVDIVFGVSTRMAENEKYSFETGASPNAVQVRSNGSIQVPPLFPTMGVKIDYRPIKSAMATQLELDVALVIDRSTSMVFAGNVSSGIEMPALGPPGWIFGTPAPPTARWYILTKSIDSFLKFMTDTPHVEHVSLSTFAEKAQNEVGLTESYQFIQSALSAHSMSYKGGLTNIGSGMIQGLASLGDRKLARPWATRVMVVVGDGIHDVGIDPIYAANLAASQGVMIYTISISNEANVQLMEQIAKIGSGKHYRAITGSELTDAFREIAESLPTLITY